MNSVAETPGQIELFAGGDPEGLRLLLPLPLRVQARVRLSDERVFRARTHLPGLAEEVAVPFDDLLPAEGHPDYSSIRKRLESASAAGSGSRILGAIPLLGRERKAVFDRAAAVGIEGDLPAGPALGFHAALEVASLKAIARAYGASLPDRETARLAVRVERLIAGGEGDYPSRLVATTAPTVCVVPVRGEEPGEPVPLPAGVVLLVLASGGSPVVGTVRAGRPRPGHEEASRATSFLEALRRSEGLRELGRAMRSVFPAVSGGHAAPRELVEALERLGSERGVFGVAAAGPWGGEFLVALVDSRGEPAVREHVSGRPGLRVLCRIGRTSG